MRSPCLIVVLVALALPNAGCRDRPAKPAAATATASTAPPPTRAALALFAADPLHPYNVARAALFAQEGQVTRPACMASASGCGALSLAQLLQQPLTTVSVELGGDEPLALLGGVEHLRPPARQAQAIAALRAVLTIDPRANPLAAVMLQADLWERFDALKDGERFGDSPPDFAALEHAVARAVRALALPKAMLLSLPSNLPEIAGAYPELLAGWPAGWSELRTESAGGSTMLLEEGTRHTHTAGDRTLFRVRVRTEPPDWLVGKLPASPGLALPPGSRLSLAASPIAIDDEGALVALPLVTLIELRKAAPVQDRPVAELPFNVLEAMRSTLVARPWQRAALTELPRTAAMPMGASCAPDRLAQTPLSASCLLCHRNPERLMGPMAHGAARLSLETDPAHAATQAIARKLASPAFAALKASWR